MTNGTALMQKGEPMSELKPCPFCGAPYPYITFEHGYIDDSAVVFCNHCKISVKLEENDQEGYNATTKRKAIEAWNRRVGESGEGD
jgi:Lar family restriction alleviation protein